MPVNTGLFGGAPASSPVPTFSSTDDPLSQIDIGGTIHNLFGSVGDLMSSKAYHAARVQDIAAEYASLGLGKVEEIQQRQQEHGVIGAQEAITGSSGLNLSGTALDLLRESKTQAAMGRASIEQQANLTAQGYAAAEEAAKKAQQGSFWGGVANLVGTVASVAAAF